VRVLVSCCAGYGHLQPMLPLAKALADGGHEVAVAVDSDLLGRAKAAGFNAFAAGIGPGEGFGRLDQLFPDRRFDRLKPDEIFGWYIPHLFGEVLAPAMLLDLDRLVAEWRPDLILHETTEFAGPVSAAASGIPSACMTLGLRLPDAILDAAALAVAPLWRERGLEPEPSAGIYSHLCLDITPPSFQPYESERGRAVLQQLRPIALPPVPGEKLAGWIEAERHRPLVYMTLGTNTNSDLGIFRAAINGMFGVDLDLLVSIGFENDPEELEPLPENAHVEAYVPHSLLLPRCAAVICHAGAGTTFNALAEGLPLLVLPQGADQYLIAGLVAAAGAGLKLDPAEVNPASVREAVLALLGDGGFRGAAGSLKAEIAGMPGPEAAVSLIEELINPPP
jgi:UDP:flavonoid glycosyltransferase YjiC (YdhE family)